MFSFLAPIYVPYSTGGGLIYDDWSVWGLGEGASNLVDAYRQFFPSFSNRPLAPIFYAITSRFKGQASGYILVDLALWITATLVTAKALGRKFGSAFVWTLFLIAAVPSFSSTVIFSPAMQSIGALSMLVWALSLRALVDHLESGSRFKRRLSFVYALASLLIYENVIPLFAFNLVLPLLYGRSRNESDRSFARRYFTSYAFPIFGVVFTVVFYQKTVIRLLYGDISRLRITTLKEGSAIFVSNLGRLFRTCGEIAPIQLFQAVGRLPEFTFKVWVELTTSMIAASLLLMSGSAFHVRRRDFLWMAAGISAALLGVVMMQTAARAYLTIYGYLNRAMAPFTIIIACACALFISGHRVWVRSLFLIVFTAYLSSFVIQRNNYLEAARLTQSLVQDALARLSAAAPDIDIHHPACLLANVPEYVVGNFNGETVFSDEVGDWGLALSLQSKGKVTGNTATPTKARQRRIKVDDQQVSVDHYFQCSLSQTWYYEFDGSSGKSKLMRLGSRQAVENILKALEIKINPAG